MQTTKATAILRLDMDGDPWGTTMNHLFDACEVLEHRHYTSGHNADHARAALADVQFTDGLGCRGDLDSWPFTEYRRWPTRQLVRLVRILNRYADRLDRAGESY